MRALIVLAVLLTAPSPAMAERCREITDDAKRLACYDKANAAPQTHTTHDGAPLPAETVKAGAWFVHRGKSKLDDSPLIGVVTVAKKGKHTLTLGCVENTTTARITFADAFFSSYRAITADYRIDDGKPRKQRFRPSTSRDTVGLWTGAVAIPFIKGLFGGTSLYVRAPTHNGGYAIAEFDITGLAQSIAPLRDACHW